VITTSACPVVTDAPTDQVDSTHTTPSQCGGRSIPTVSPGARSNSSVSRLAVLATQFAVVSALSSMRSPESSS
jgi:hypothetical protein